MLKKILLPLFCVVLITGCSSTYRTPNSDGKPLSEMAILENNNHMKTNIIEVDGKHRGVGMINKYILTPENHTLKISLFDGIGGGGDAVISFKVEANNVYELLYSTQEIEDSSSKYLWRPYIINKATNEEIITKNVE